MTRTDTNMYTSTLVPINEILDDDRDSNFFRVIPEILFESVSPSLYVPDLTLPRNQAVCREFVTKRDPRSFGFIYVMDLKHLRMLQKDRRAMELENKNFKVHARYEDFPSFFRHLRLSFVITDDTISKCLTLKVPPQIPFVVVGWHKREFSETYTGILVTAYDVRSILETMQANVTEELKSTDIPLNCGESFKAFKVDCRHPYWKNRIKGLEFFDKRGRKVSDERWRVNLLCMERSSWVPAKMQEK